MAPMPKTTKQKPTAPTDDRLTQFVRVRLTKTDANALDAEVARHPLARRAAVAREALRRGLAAMAADGK